MNTIRNFLLFLVAGAVMAGCNKVSTRKTKGGMPYQLYKGSGGQKLVGGDFVKVSITAKINDSVYFTTKGSLPQYLRVNETAQPYDISEVWASVSKGDSFITTQMMDTFIKRNPGSVGPQFKKGDRVITQIKILDVFKTDSATKADLDKETKIIQTAESAVVAKYVADKKINAVKTPGGVYVEIINPGTGAMADSGKFVSLNYTGKTFAGKIFDSNTDSAFHHVQPLSFVVGGAQMIKGLDEAVRVVKLGGTAKAYIPSTLGYGANPDPRSGIKPFDNLIFEFTVTDVKDKAPQAEAPPAAPQPKVDMPQPKKK